MSWPRYKLSTSSLEGYQHTNLFGVVLTVSSENLQKIMSFQREMSDADILGKQFASIQSAADTNVLEDPAASIISHLLP
jgi:hypothetical protein